MVWELLAIWAVIAASIIWFFHDESKEQRSKLNQRARALARTPAWHQSQPVISAQVAPRDPQRQTEIQRKFLEEMRRLRP